MGAGIRSRFSGANIICPHYYPSAFTLIHEMLSQITEFLFDEARDCDGGSKIWTLL